MQSAKLVGRNYPPEFVPRVDGARHVSVSQTLILSFTWILLSFTSVNAEIVANRSLEKVCQRGKVNLFSRVLFPKPQVSLRRSREGLV